MNKSHLIFEKVCGQIVNPESTLSAIKLSVLVHVTAKNDAELSLLNITSRHEIKTFPTPVTG